MSKVSAVKEPSNFRKITLTIEIESEVEHYIPVDQLAYRS